MQGRTLPPVASHRASFKGQQLTLEVQVNNMPGIHRSKVACFANEYVGTVRRRIAHQLGCEPQRVRMLHAGKQASAHNLSCVIRSICWKRPICLHNCNAGDEWKNDTQLLMQVMSKMSGRQLVIATVSPVDNSYTVQSPNQQQLWEQSSIATLARMVRW